MGQAVEVAELPGIAAGTAHHTADAAASRIWAGIHPAEAAAQAGSVSGTADLAQADDTTVYRTQLDTAPNEAPALSILARAQAEAEVDGASCCDTHRYQPAAAVKVVSECARADVAADTQLDAQAARRAPVAHCVNARMTTADKRAVAAAAAARTLDVPDHKLRDVDPTVEGRSAQGTLRRLAVADSDRTPALAVALLPRPDIQGDSQAGCTQEMAVVEAE